MLDTGPIVGWLRSDDPDHDACVEATMSSAGAGRLLTTTWEVIGEAYTLIRYRFATNATAAMKVLHWARSVTVLVTEQADHERAAALLSRHDSLRLSYVDALLLAMVERHRLEELITLDGELSAVRLSHPAVVTVL